jgi:hypothetical protein
MSLKYEILKSTRFNIRSDTQLIVSNDLFNKLNDLDDHIIDLAEDIRDWYKD